MASTAHKTAAELVDHQDAPDVLETKIEKLAKLIQDSKCQIVWTGAGISTSCADARPEFQINKPGVRTGVPDFRSKDIGKWSLQASGEKMATDFHPVSTINAAPTATHMALVTLLRSGQLKNIISSNTDSLHRRSGVLPSQLSELHGNGNKAFCNKCDFEALTDNRVRVAKGSKNHGTGVKCPQCEKGEMCDCIVNFGEYLRKNVVESAEAASNTPSRPADLLLVLGSSLRVITCEALDNIETNRGKLVIVNKQITPYDKQAALRIYADCDEVMKGVMKKLGLEILPFVLDRFVEVDLTDFFSENASSSTSSTNSIIVNPIDENNHPYSWIKQVRFGIQQEEEVSSPKEEVSTSASAATASSSNASAATATTATAAAASTKQNKPTTSSTTKSKAVATSSSSSSSTTSTKQQQPNFVPLAVAALSSNQQQYRPLTLKVFSSAKKNSSASSSSSNKNFALEFTTFGHRSEGAVTVSIPANNATANSKSMKFLFKLHYHHAAGKWTYETVNV